MRSGVFPSRRALLAFLPGLLLTGASFLWAPGVYLGLAADVLVLLLVLADWLVSPSYRNKLVVGLAFPASAQLGRPNAFSVTVENLDRLAVRFRLLLDFDESCDRAYGRETLAALPGDTVECTLRLTPRRRGHHRSELVFIQGRSTLGLLSFYRKRKLTVEFDVPPFIQPVNQIFKLTQRRLQRTEGQQKSAFLGEGRDFEMLKRYAKGDDFNKIDWKATARLRTPVTRVYRLENALEVALLVDCGRVMTTEVSGMSLLDYAADAALVLSYSAVKNYDTVSLACFASGIQQYVPPIKNKKDINRLSLALSRCAFEHVESDYEEALRFTAQKLTKRSLVLLLTDITDDSNLMIFSRAFQVLRRKHLVLLALIRDKNLFRAAGRPADRTTSLFAKAAAADLILRRQKTMSALRRLGVDILDVYPEEISASLVSRYLDVKSRN